MCGSLLDAMALAKPVIMARNIPGNRFLTHGHTGLLFDSSTAFLDLAKQVVQQQPRYLDDDHYICTSINHHDDDRSITTQSDRHRQSFSFNIAQIVSNASDYVRLNHSWETEALAYYALVQELVNNSYD
jgi:glycosyltransferase involved in cell wall biosynthesis